MKNSMEYFYQKTCPLRLQHSESFFIKQSMYLKKNRRKSTTYLKVLNFIIIHLSVSIQDISFVMQNIFLKFQHPIISLSFCHRVARRVAGRFVAYHFVDKSSYQSPESSFWTQLGQPGVPQLPQFKGHKISKANYGVLNSTKKTNAGIIFNT